MKIVVNHFIKKLISLDIQKIHHQENNVFNLQLKLLTLKKSMIIEKIFKSNNLKLLKIIILLLNNNKLHKMKIKINQKWNLINNKILKNFNLIFWKVLFIIYKCFFIRSLTTKQLLWNNKYLNFLIFLIKLKNSKIKVKIKTMDSKTINWVHIFLRLKIEILKFKK